MFKHIVIYSLTNFAKLINNKIINNDNLKEKAGKNSKNGIQLCNIISYDYFLMKKPEQRSKIIILLQKNIAL